MELFVAYVCDGRYGWGPVCEERFGTHPVQVFHEWNTAVHRSDGEARPDRRPLSREELQALFDYADEQVARIAGKGRKGWLAAYRDSVLFKTMYAWGLRRREAAILDVTDWGPNAQSPQFGRFGVLNVRSRRGARVSICANALPDERAGRDARSALRPRASVGDQRQGQT